MNRKIYILINPASRSGNQKKILRQMEQIFTRDGLAPVILESSGNGGMKRLARQITQGGEETVLLIVGGDGSVNEVLNGVCDLDKVLLGVIPAGSSNDFCRSIGATDPLGCAVRILRNLSEGITVSRDIGRIRYLDLGSSSWKERYFNVSAGLGFDAAVCARADRSPLKKLLNAIHLGKLIYITTAIYLILTSTGTTFRILLDGKKPQELLYRDTLFAVCMNHKYEGGGFMFCPDASAEDGKLDICVPSGITRLSFFRLFPLAYSGKHAGHRCVVLRQAEKFRIEAAVPQYLHTDGEAVIRTTHMEAEIIPQAVRFLL